MNDQEKIDMMLDERLDQALAQYSGATPGPGLETRILGRVRERADANRSVWWRWMAAAAAVAALLLAVFMMRVPQLETKQPSGTLIAMPSHATSSPELNSSTRNQRSHARIARHPAVQTPRTETVAVRIVKRATFPAPRPLSAEEQLLLAYMKHTPREEIVAQSHPDEPLTPEINEFQIQAPAVRKNFDTK